MPLLFNLLSRLVIIFLPRNKCLLISWLHSLSAVILEPNNIKFVTVSIVSPPICHEMMGSDTMISVFFVFFCAFYFLFLLLLFFTLQYCIGFAIHPHESTMVYTCSQSWTPLPPPSPYHPSGSSQCTSPKHPVSCIKPGLVFVSYMILYMFQCHSPKSSHRFPLPQSPKDCSKHLCLFCCLAYRIIVTIFLNSIYMC